MPNSVSGTPAPGSLSQWPSIAAILAGWCLSVFRPWKSPTTACSGAEIASMAIAIANIFFTAGLRSPRSRCQAPDAPTISAVARNAAMPMCARR